MLYKKHKATYQNLLNGQKKVIRLLDLITQEHSDMNVEEFMNMYLFTKKELNRSESDVIESWAFTDEKQPEEKIIHSDPILNKTNCNISKAFQTDALDAMDYNEGDEDYYW
jgi:hypothetical protein|tara:strand:- start:1601 stop:1933 length:333 start_codon:yes stop_codon:yes gene_type:complete